ncbi:HAMP domain-containing histidine kinase [Luteimonas fraxinea]|uniref:histidine kinase n=1 Tax=Luteimonas fraxinea TaxID=2901869 RepID=A0ABS8UGL2_9GAMM|nr:HAMP domain-containing sensor histidine kinase [Luteimonas fraxinea]MCD9098189.1 HAMP domain-containing histidine kinase [Luteimonas fraxinea]MCD9126915.1 HAMP domain-containing histidine kinase [Luteimonas fraxinea]UHH08869.1 HAMP domain-containing histidine kinase [Luteimonas fraxinea]
MFKAWRNWLSDLPIADPVDRRNAQAVQGLLLFLGISLPLATGFGLSVLWPIRHLLPEGVGNWVPHSASIVLAALCFACIAMIRRGAFHAAMKALLVALIAILYANAFANGFRHQLPAQLHPMLLIVLSGLIFGRRAIWIVFPALVGSVLVGAARDALHAQNLLTAFVNVPPAIFGYLAVAVLTSRTTEAMRESLRDAQARRQELEVEIKEREKTHAQLIHAQKKEITERMASGLAHDLNNIFAVIAGFSASAFEDDGRSDGDRVIDLERNLRAIEDSARRGMAANRKLLRFSRLDTAMPERFDAADAIEELAPMLRQLLEARIILKINRDPVALPIVFDRSQFELMLLNLASNSRDAIDGDGVISIGVTRAAAYNRITIEDDGQGMSEEVATRAFEPFYSTKPSESGTGLGLAVVRDLVTRYGGTIELRTSVGEGTCFLIALPNAH